MEDLDWVLGGKIDKRPGMANFWSLLDHGIPSGPGAYILVAKPGVRFNYPTGRSAVFYIGQSSDLRRRLNEHLKYSLEVREDPMHELYWPRYEYSAAFGSRYALLEDISPKTLEEELFHRFAQIYHSFPVANGQGSWKRINQI